VRSNGRGRDQWFSVEVSSQLVEGSAWHPSGSGGVCALCALCSLSLHAGLLKTPEGSFRPRCAERHSLGAEGPMMRPLLYAVSDGSDLSHFLLLTT
jgi:hypothetical protein